MALKFLPLSPSLAKGKQLLSESEEKTRGERERKLEVVHVFNFPRYFRNIDNCMQGMSQIHNNQHP